MRLRPDQQNASALHDLARAGLDLLATAQFDVLVERYGYALACGRDPADAVRADLDHALSNACGTALGTVDPGDIAIVFHEKNDAALHAAIDCQVSTGGGRPIAISFVVTGTGAQPFLTLEDICAGPDPDARC